MQWLIIIGYMCIQFSWSPMQKVTHSTEATDKAIVLVTALVNEKPPGKALIDISVSAIH